MGYLKGYIFFYRKVENIQEYDVDIPERIMVLKTIIRSGIKKFFDN